MTSTIRAVTVDCRDPERVGRFWADALGYGDDPDNPNTSGDPEWLLVSPDGVVHLLFHVADSGRGDCKAGWTRGNACRGPPAS
jgi:Glyoxalase-like domain